MQAVKHGGLSGKARRARARNRAARLYASQLIVEYLEPDSGERHRGRYIPIRGRNVFFPSVTHSSIAQTEPMETVQSATRLELPPATDDKRQKIDLPPDAGRATPGREPEPGRDAAIGFSRAAKPGNSPVTEPVGTFDRRQNFTLSGFFLGCAMGGAAAALVLLVLQTAIR